MQYGISRRKIEGEGEGRVRRGESKRGGERENENMLF